MPTQETTGPLRLSSNCFPATNVEPRPHQETIPPPPTFSGFFVLRLDSSTYFSPLLVFTPSARPTEEVSGFVCAAEASTRVSGLIRVSLLCLGKFQLSFCYSPDARRVFVCVCVCVCVCACACVHCIFVLARNKTSTLRVWMCSREICKCCNNRFLFPLNESSALYELQTLSFSLRVNTLN